tara:strand:- start:195 stop:983 length:789 start_codon:yes stop_codon:yes gene_type:complete
MGLIIFIFFGYLLVRHLFFWIPLSGNHVYKKNTTLFIAHRGLHKKEPENTTASIKKAIKRGFTAVELDTFMSLDKKIVCSHNIDLERKTNGRGFVDEKKHNELKTIIHRTNKNKNPDRGLPLIGKILEETKKEILFFIDIKTKRAWDIYPAIKLVKLIKKHKKRKSVIVSSFNPLIVFFVKRLDPKILTGLIIKKQSSLKLTNIVHPDFLHPRGDIVNDTLVSYAKKKHLPINTWTINNAAAWKWLHKKGVSGIITDEPVVI